MLLTPVVPAALEAQSPKSLVLPPEPPQPHEERLPSSNAPFVWTQAQRSSTGPLPPAPPESAPPKVAVEAWAEPERQKVKKVVVQPTLTPIEPVATWQLQLEASHHHGGTHSSPKESINRQGLLQPLVGLDRIPRERMHQLFAAIGLERDSKLRHDELCRLVATSDCSPEDRQLLKAALAASYQGSNSSKLGGEDLRQALKLGTVDSARTTLQRMRGRSPAHGESVPAYMILEYLERRRDRRCLPAFASIINFVVFSILAIGHTHVNMSHKMLKAVELGMAFPSPEPLTVEPIWTWLAGRSGILHVAPGVEALGGIRIAQPGLQGSWTPQVLCSRNRLSVVGNILQGKLSGDARPKRCSSQPTTKQWLLSVLDANASISLISQVRNSWQPQLSGAAIPPQSRLVVQLAARNTALKMFAIYQVVLELDSSGLLLIEKAHGAFDVQTAWADLSEDLGRSLPLMLLDLVFGCTTAFSILYGLIILQRTCKKVGCRAGLVSSLSWPAFVGTVDVIVRVLAMLCYADGAIQGRGLRQLASDLPVLSQQQRYSEQQLAQVLAGKGSSSTAYQEALDAIIEQAVRVAGSWSEFRWYVAILGACMCLQVIKAMPFKRLRMILKVLSGALHDLGHVALVFGVALLGLVIAVYVIHGGRAEAFSTVGESLLTTLLLLPRAHFQYLHNERGQFGGFLGIAWLWAAGIILGLAMVKMMVAVVVNLYLEVTSSAPAMSPVWRDAWDMSGETRRKVEQLRAAAESSLGDGTHQQQSEAPSPTSERMAAIKHAMRTFPEEKIRHLLQKMASRDKAVSNTTLAAALGAQTREAKAHIDHILQQAVAEQPIHKVRPNVTNMELLRLCNRLTMGTCDLSKGVAELQSVFQVKVGDADAGAGKLPGACKSPEIEAWVDGGDAAMPVTVPSRPNTASGAAATGALTPKDTAATDVTKMPEVMATGIAPKRPDTANADAGAGPVRKNAAGAGVPVKNEKQTSRPVTGSSVEGPLPERTHFHEALDEKLRELEAADHICCSKLEVKLASLAEGLAKLRQRRMTTAQERSFNLYQLELSVNDLTDSIAPLFATP